MATQPHATSRPPAPPLSAAEEALLSPEAEARAIREGVQKANVQRARPLGPLLAIVHVIHVLVFQLADITGGASPAVAAAWRSQLVVAHATAAVVSTLLALITFRGNPAIASRALNIAGAFYLVYGAWVASIDQLVTPAMTPFVIVCVGAAVAVAWSPRVAVGAYVAGYVALAILCWRTQPDMARRVSLLLNGLTVSAVGLGLSFYVWRTTVRRIHQQVLIGAQHRALTRLASRDALTDLPNRRVFSHALGRAVQEAERGRPTTVALLDLDHFKQVNDTLGHEVGDAVLVAVAAHLRQHLRTDDLAARLGGEEFGIVLSGTEAEHAHELLETLRRRLEAEPMGAAAVSVTASIGYSQVRADDGADGREALKRADDALYAAKAAGRNRVRAG